MTGMQMAHFISPVLDATACSLWPAAYHVAQVPSFQASILLPPSVVVPPLPIAGAGGSQKAQPCLIDLVGCFGAAARVTRLWTNSRASSNFILRADPRSLALVATQLLLSLVSPLLPRLSPTNRDLPATQNTRTHTSWASNCHIQHSQQHGVVGPPVHRRCPAGVRSGTGPLPCPLAHSFSDDARSFSPHT
jgi:hypothetical protein